MKDKILLNEVKRNVTDLFVLEEEFRGIKDKYEKKKEKLSKAIKNYFFVSGEDKVKFDCDEALFGGDKILQCKKVTRRSVVFDAEKVEKALGKDIAEKVIVKKIEVTDYKGMVDMLKSYGVKPKDFKKFISVKKEVNTKMLEQCEELGEFDREDIKGCYKVENIGTSYLRVTMKQVKN